MLLRGKLESFENAIEVAREIECVLEFESKPVELHAKVGALEEQQSSGVGVPLALRELTERLEKMEARIQSVVQSIVATGGSKTRR